MEGLERTIRLNTLILFCATALNWAVVVLVASLTTLTTAHYFGLPELAGLAFGLYLLAYAAGGLTVGRLVDALGRRRGLAVAFLVGAVGAAIVYFGLLATSLPLSLAGLLALGLGGGGANLTRVAGADMYPPARRARGIAMVLLGAAFGAIGAPIVFAPVLAGARSFEAGPLAAPWPIAAAIMLAGALLVLLMRVDPRQVAEQLAKAARPAHEPASVEPASVEPASVAPAPPPRPLLELLAVPLVPLALLAAIVGQAVMTATMALAGLILADHGHHLGDVSLTVSVHFVGMFGLVLFVGRLVEAIGRFRSVVLGLLVLAGGVIALLPMVALPNYLPGMFAVGVGWNIAFVASTTILADVARSNERGRLLGASDFVAICAAALLTVIAGLILAVSGVAALVIVGALLALIPAALIAFNRTRLEGVAAGG